MSENSSIEWTDTTWNPVTGCTKVSPGCAHCYAETFAERWRGVPGHPYEQGFDLKLWPERLSLPLSWKKPRRVFVNSMSDLFHEDVPFEFIDRVFAVMALTPQHTYQVLTKRPERMREYLTNRARPFGEAQILYPTPEWVVMSMQRDASPSRIELSDAIDRVRRWPLPNVWLGTSVELQRWADVRIPELLATPAAVRFLSCEPLLGPLDLTRIDATSDSDPGFSALYWDEDYEGTLGDATIDWVIVGGESGPGARPFDLAWARSIVSQCRAAGVAVFVKQLGAKPYAALTEGELFPPNGMSGARFTLKHDDHTKAAMYPRLKSRKGGDMAEWPKDLRVREFPIYEPRYPDGMGIPR